MKNIYNQTALALSLIHISQKPLRRLGPAHFPPLLSGLLLLYGGLISDKTHVRLTPTSLGATGGDRKSTRLNSSHLKLSRMPSSA